MRGRAEFSIQGVAPEVVGTTNGGMSCTWFVDKGSSAVGAHVVEHVDVALAMRGVERVD